MVSKFTRIVMKLYFGRLIRDGDITLLKVTAIVNPTNESLTDKNAISERIFEVAGPELRDECKQQIRGELSCCTLAHTS